MPENTKTYIKTANYKTISLGNKNTHVMLFLCYVQSAIKKIVQCS